MAATALLANAFLIDCVGAEPRERASVLVEGERIKEVRLQGNTLLVGTTQSSTARG